MGRADTWLDRGGQRKSAYLGILNENAGSVNVYRYPTDVAGVGFTKEANDVEFVKAITARIDKARTKSFAKLPDGDQTPAKIIALTDEKDVRQGDFWRQYDLGDRLRFYRVVNVEANEAGNTVHLDELRKSAWPPGTV